MIIIILFNFMNVVEKLFCNLFFFFCLGFKFFGIVLECFELVFEFYGYIKKFERDMIVCVIVDVDVNFSVKFVRV